jgi:outer membrane protein OmpA-like peptidoglycan-associated protein
MRRLAAALAILPALAAQAGAETDELRFVACPIYRDTDAGRKSGCWLADDVADGVRYDITAGPTKPDWNRAVLVEGRVAVGGGNPCGGTILDPVRVSVLDEPCPRHMLPAEGYPGRRFGLPKTVLAPLYVAREAPKGPFGPRSFIVPYDFGSAFLVYQLADYQLDEAARYILAAQARRIVVVGYADTRAALVSGRRLAEAPQLAAERAESIRTSLVRLGVPAGRITVRTDLAPEPTDAEITGGLLAPSRRRVEVRIEIRALPSHPSPALDHHQ